MIEADATVGKTYNSSKKLRASAMANMFAFIEILFGGGMGQKWDRRIESNWTSAMRNGYSE